MLVGEQIYQHPEVETLDRNGLLALQDRKLRALGERFVRNPE